MLRKLRQRLLAWGVPGALALFWAGSPVAAQEGDLKALIERLDRLEKQNEELRRMVNQQAAVTPSALPTSTGVSGTPSPTSAVSENQVHSIVEEYLGKKEAAEKQAATATESKGFVVGKDLNMSVRWTGNQPWLETADKAFRFHVGGRAQFDIVESTAPTSVQNGTGGIGSFDNGVNFRRARLEADGWLWEVIDFFTEYDFINSASFATPATSASSFNTPAPTDVWAGINYLPIIGGVRVGNLKAPIGLSHLTSSRYLDFLERDHGFDTYYNRNNGFMPGIQIFNYTENQRASWQLAWTKMNNAVFGWNVGDNETQWTSRFTFLPVYRDEGRYMVHLGMGSQYNRLDEQTAVLRNRSLLRNGPATLHSTTALANLRASDQYILNPEFFMNFGPLSIQAEYIASWVNNVTNFTTQVQASTATASKTFFSQSAYVQALYFLTGEHRPYAKTALHGSGAAPTRVVPYRNFFWVPGTGCPNPFSVGAWQVGARYSWVDLTDNGIVGGNVHEVTAGLNWFLNPNIKFQWNYDIGYRSVDGATSSGTFQQYGMRMALDF